MKKNQMWIYIVIAIVVVVGLLIFAMSLKNIEKAWSNISNIPINIRTFMGQTYGAHAVKSFCFVSIVYIKLEIDPISNVIK